MIDRRKARLLREYLYKKSIESRDKQIYERKEELAKAIKDGKHLSASEIKEARNLQSKLIFDENQKLPAKLEDDEYANAGISDPLLLITTSRDPSSRLRQFVKEMTHIFPNSIRINRGKYVIGDLVDLCRKNNVTDLLIIHESRGEPDGLIISHLPHGPTAYFSLQNVLLRHDIPDRGNIAEQYPHLIMDNFTSSLGIRISNILKYLFPHPKEESKRVITFSNNNDFVSFRCHVFIQTGREVQLSEVGPRFELRPYQIKLGTIDIEEADIEWVYRPFHNTAHKRNLL